MLRQKVKVVKNFKKCDQRRSIMSLVRYTRVLFWDFDVSIVL